MDDVTTLADTARELMRRHPTRKVSDPFPPDVRGALTALADAIAATGVDRRDAEYAVTQWLIMDSTPIGECVAEQQTDQARSARRPPPRDLRP